MKDKKLLMQESRARMAKAGLVPFSGHCYPETKVKIEKLEQRDRKRAGAPIKGN